MEARLARVLFIADTVIVVICREVTLGFETSED